MSEARKQLTIRTGAVKRLTKELKLYKEERTQEEKRVDKIKADGADQHDVKHAEEVLAEAGMMIPIARQKLKDSAQELSTLQSTACKDLVDTEEYKEASTAIKLAQEIIEAS